VVLRHLTDLPLTRQGGEHLSSQVPAHAGPSILLEDKKLVHPMGVRADLGCPIHQCETSVASGNRSDVCTTVVARPEAIERIPVLAMDVEVLVPYVRQIVLVELEHSLNRQSILGNSQSDLTRRVECLGCHGWRLTFDSRRVTGPPDIVPLSGEQAKDAECHELCIALPLVDEPTHLTTGQIPQYVTCQGRPEVNSGVVLHQERDVGESLVSNH